MNNNWGISAMIFMSDAVRNENKWGIIDFFLFLHAISCFDHINSLTTNISCSFHHCWKCRPYWIRYCDVTQNASYWLSPLLLYTKIGVELIFMGDIFLLPDSQFFALYRKQTTGPETLMMGIASNVPSNGVCLYCVNNRSKVHMQVPPKSITIQTSNRSIRNIRICYIRL